MSDTFVSCRHCGKEHNKERCGIFPSIRKVWEFLFCVIVSAQTLRKAPPRRETSDQRSQPIQFATAFTSVYKRNKT